MVGFLGLGTSFRCEGVSNVSTPWADLDGQTVCKCAPFFKVCAL
jgi:hypothetical protein